MSDVKTMRELVKERRAEKSRRFWMNVVLWLFGLAVAAIVLDLVLPLPPGQ